MTKFARRPTKSLTELPPRLRNKIVLEPETAGEQHACWVWTGSFSPARQRYRAYRVPENRDTFSDHAGTIVKDRGTPNTWCKELGYATAAQRVVYAECVEIPVKDVPRLERCQNDRCVSPWHGRPLGAVLTRRAVPEPEVGPQPGGASYERVLARLKEVGPHTEMLAPSAADECGLKPEDVTPEVWRAYCAWDAERPNDD